MDNITPVSSETGEGIHLFFNLKRSLALAHVDMIGQSL
jgi:hypothetical protein